MSRVTRCWRRVTAGRFSRADNGERVSAHALEIRIANSVRIAKMLSRLRYAVLVDGCSLLIGHVVALLTSVAGQWLNAFV